MVTANKAVLGFNLIWMWDKVEQLTPMVNDMLSFWTDANNPIPAPHVGHQFPFDRALDAIKLFQTGATTGKVVLEVP